jgi:nitrogen fixation protein NifU and related proteins
MELDSLYQQVILDHYKRPLHKGLSKNSGVQVHHINPSCGDEVTVKVSVKDEVVTEVTWDGVGCSISQASVSMMSDLVTGLGITEANVILDEFTALMQSKGTSEGNSEILDDAVAFAGVSKYPARIKCALLGWMAFKDASVQAQAQ